MRFSKYRLSFKASLFSSAVLVLLTLVVHQLWLRSKAAELSELDRQIAQVQLKLSADQLAYDELAKRAPASIETSLAAQLLTQYLKYNGQFSGLVNGIVSNSKTNDFMLTKIISENQSHTAGYTQTLYSVEAEASFISIGKFLEKMEDSPLLTEVTSIEISRIGAEMKRCRAKIKLFSYVGHE